MKIKNQFLIHRKEQQKFTLLLVSIFLTIGQAHGQDAFPQCGQEEDHLGLLDACYVVTNFNTITTYYRQYANNVTSRLRIDHSNTSVLMKEDFQNSIFDKIETLYFDYDSIEVFNPEPLTGLKNLKELVLFVNYLYTIYDNSFAGLNLSAISMQNNMITNIQERAFGSQVNLIRINLAGNRLTQLPAYLFQGLDKLEYLNLGRNKLSSIDENLFQDLINLKHLILSSNRILRIGSNTLKSLSKLYGLHLDSNKLTVIDKDVFIENTKLKILDLSDNNLSNLNNVFLNISSLMKVKLNRNNIKIIPREFFHLLPGLDEIDLSYNELNISTDVFDNLPVLRRVYVGGSRWSEVPLEGFRNAEWKEGDYPRYNIFVGFSFDCNITETPRLNSGIFHNFSYIEKVVTCHKTS